MVAIWLDRQISINDVLTRSNTNGLANVGATCYINTTIQCLGYCPPFFRYILSAPWKKNNTPLANNLRNVYASLWIEQQPIAPHGFLRNLHETMGQNINIFEQNDMSEFLMLYLDKLNVDLSIEILVDDDDINELKKKMMVYQDEHYRGLAFDMELAWINSVKKEYSPIIDLFYGQLVSQIVCGNCHHVHHNYETYCNLSLPLSSKHKNARTLEQTLERFFKDEIINEKEQVWKCDTCKEKKPSTKSLRLWRNPSVLILNLKRFDYNLVKNTTAIKAPIELDLSKFCINTEKRKYKLVAVGHHHGGVSSGHYNCICRHRNNKWYAIDDVIVREANDKEIEYVLNNGYMYFYEFIS